jgi:E3 ubiquitin-protein ligase TRIP12
MCPVVETIGRISPLFSMVKCHPLLFPLRTRLLFVQLLTFDVPVALSIFQQNFEKPGAVRNEQHKLSLTVDRDCLFENGVTIFAKLGATPLAFDIRFLGEAGIGVGPTHEFFTLFSEQLCTASTDLWRSERTLGDYVFDRDGLFPRPDASLDLMRVVGTLCAKALSMSTVVSFSFNPAFFSLVRGEEVDVGDVDPALARSLGWPEGLLDLPFTYSGIPTLQMAAAECVTSQNVSNYVGLVRMYTCGEVLRQVAAAFRQGFSAVIPWEAMNVFSCEEVCKLLRGDACAFTREDLRKNVQNAHGYQDDSPQIGMLFDVLLEFSDGDRSLFVKFVTGAKALPIGGLAALMPKLTVALRVTENGALPDATFPSVMTCANYLKLPEYSTKEVLRDRLTYAIHECQNVFELT